MFIRWQHLNICCLVKIVLVPFQLLRWLKSVVIKRTQMNSQWLLMRPLETLLSLTSLSLMSGEPLGMPSREDFNTFSYSNAHSLSLSLILLEKNGQTPNTACAHLEVDPVWCQPLLPWWHECTFRPVTVLAMMMLYMYNNASSEMRSQDMSYRAPGAGNDTFSAISFHHNCKSFFKNWTVADFPAALCHYSDFSLPFAF